MTDYADPLIRARQQLARAEIQAMNGNFEMAGVFASEAHAAVAEMVAALKAMQEKKKGQEAS